MKSKECRAQAEKFAGMASSAVESADKERFTNLSNIWKKKAQEAFDLEIAERWAAFESRILEKTGDFEAWMEWAKSLYTYEKQSCGDWIVRSSARVWKEEVSWEVDSEIGALEKIEQLIGYKIRDRKRGHGDMGKDLLLAEVQGSICRANSISAFSGKDGDV